MQHEAAAGIDRAALQHLHALGVFRQLDLVGLLDDVELHQQAGKIDAAGRTVDDDAHRPFRRMRAHVDDGALEARIAHDRHGNQQLAVQIAVTGRIVANAGGFAADGLRCFAFRAHPQRPLLLIAYPDIGLGFCQSSFRRHSAADHTQFNGLRRNLPVKTSHDRDGSPARRARRRRPCMSRVRRRRFAPRMPRRGNATHIPQSGCWRDRAAARCCLAALPSSCSRDGRPIGGRPAIPASRPASTSPNRTMSKP